MVDIVWKAEWLVSCLEDELPMAARASPRLVASILDAYPGLKPLEPCVITAVRYVGSNNGIFCVVAFPSVPDHVMGEKPLVTSIAHLVFDPRHSLARDIAAYQKHRAKKIRRNLGEKQHVKRLFEDAA